MSYTKIMPRGGTLYEWSTMNPVLAEREFAVEFPDSGIATGLCRFKFGDGFRTYNELPYAFDGASASSIVGGNAFSGNLIQIRADSYDNWMLANPVLEENELVYDTTRRCFFIGDGVSRFNQLKPAGQQLIYDFGDEDEDNIISPLTNGVVGASLMSAHNNAPQATLADLMNQATMGNYIETAPVNSDSRYIVGSASEKLSEPEREDGVIDDVSEMEEEEEMVSNVTDESDEFNDIEEELEQPVPVEEISPEEAIEGEVEEEYGALDAALDEVHSAEDNQKLETGE